MTITLASRLHDSAEHLSTLAPADLLDVLADEQRRLVRSEGDDAAGRVARGVRLEQRLLPDASGRAVPVLGEGPTVVVFYRGAWCPFCNVALSSYQREVLPELTRQGGSLVAVSPQGPDGTLSIAEANDLAFAVLTDVGGVWARELGLAFDLDDDVAQVHRALGNDFDTINAGAEWALPRPTVIVVDAGGVVRFVDVQSDYTRRTEPAAILEAVRALG